MHIPVAQASMLAELLGLPQYPAPHTLTVFENTAMALQARKTAGVASDAQRLDRLTEQSSGTMITTRSMASMDDEEEAVQRINVILKVSWLGLAQRVLGHAQEEC